MASLRLRDRDAIITDEELIFRVYGYFHPPEACVCDVEYAPSTLFRSPDPRALRVKGSKVYYKFYGDEGLRFVREKYPRYTVFYEPLQERLVGVPKSYIGKTRRPNKRFKQLIGKPPKDLLLKALHKVFKTITDRSGLSAGDFGVFGSLLHGFHHPKFSDLDFTIYGKKKLGRLSEALGELYLEGGPLQNEFDSKDAIKGKPWRFLNYSPKEYLWHQRRKMIYALFADEESGRVIKTEFEPVKDWDEIYNEYSPDTRIMKGGWVKALARITEDNDTPFLPSIYQIEIMKLLEGPRVGDIQRVISYLEEFRMQAKRDEEVYVEGNLEQVITSEGTFYQITLTYGPRYYEQALKVLNP